MQLKKFKKINIEVLLKLMVLLGFSFFFSYILITDKILLYISPRNIIYVKFSVMILLLLSLFVTKDIFKPTGRVNIFSYLIFIIPLLMALIFPAKPMNLTSIASIDIKANEKFIDRSTNTSSDNAVNNESKYKDANDSSTNADSNLNQFDMEIKMCGDTIIMTDDNFSRWLTEIYTNMDKYKDKKIQLTGFVLKNDKFNKNEFVSARLMMSCCAADLQPVGFLCHYNMEDTLKKDSWITLKGTLDITTHDDEKMPLILVEDIKNTEKPKKEYIYPY